MNNYIVFCVVLILLFFILFIDYFGIYNHFDIIYENFEICKLHKYTDSDMCNNPLYSNLGQIQLYYKYQQILNSDNDSDKDIITAIYNFKLERQFFPCFYTLDKLTELTNTQNTNTRILNNNDDTYIDKPNCVFNDNSNKSLKYNYNILDITTDFNELNFISLNADKLKKTVCYSENKGLFFNNINEKLENKFLFKITLKLKNDNLTDNDILLDSISLVQFNNNQLVDITDANINYFNKLFSIGYNNDTIHYMPLLVNVDFYMFTNNLCDVYIEDNSISNKKQIPFNLSDIGFYKSIILDHDYYNIDNTDIGIYDTDNTSINMSNAVIEINTHIDTYQSKLVDKRIDSLEKCLNNFETQSFNKRYIGNKIDNSWYEKRILSLNNFLRPLKRLKKQKKNNIITSTVFYNNAILYFKKNKRKETEILKYCTYNIELLKKDLENCKINLQKSDEITTEITNDIKIIDDFMYNYTKKLYIDMDNYRPSSCTLNTQTSTNFVKTNINLIRTKSKLLNASVSKHIIDSIKNTEINNKDIIKYISQDNSIYFTLRD